MTDKEIIKALERLKSTKDYLRECYQEDKKNCKYPELKPLIKGTYEDNKKTFDIAIKAIEDFNRQQAEIERLQNDLAISRKETKRYAMRRAEAITEFAEKVRRYIKSYCNPYGKPTFDYDTSVKIMHFIDNLLKEMKG